MKRNSTLYSFIKEPFFHYLTAGIRRKGNRSHTMNDRVQSRSRWIWLGCIVVTGMLTLGMTGCGGAPEKMEQPPQTPAASSNETPQPEPSTSETPEPQTQNTTTTTPTRQTTVDPLETPSPNPSSSGLVTTTGGAQGSSSGSMLVEPENNQSKTPTPPVTATKRPENVADWKLEDYLSAKREGGPRLVEAIDQLGKNHIGDESVVDILAAVLKQMKPEERIVVGENAGLDSPTGTSTPRSRSGSRGSSSFSGGGGGNTLIESPGLDLGAGATKGDGPMIVAAVKALSRNATDRAYQVLRQIVTGELVTDSDRVATGTTMKVLLIKDTPENEALMLRVLLEPKKLRKGEVSAASDTKNNNNSMFDNPNETASSEPLSANDLYQMAMHLAGQLAKEPLRIKLASHLLSEEATLQQRTDIGPMFAKHHPQNVGAQLVIYRMPILDSMSEQLKEDIEQRNSELETYFVQLSSVALGHVLGALADEEVVESKAVKEEDDGGLGRIGAKNSGGGDDDELGGGLTRTAGGGFSGGGMIDGSGSGASENVIEQLKNPKVVYPLAAKLWDPKTVDTVVRRSKRITSLNEADMTLALARTMPIDRVRAAIYTVLHDRFKDGPGQFFGETSRKGSFAGGGGFSTGLDLEGGGFAGGGTKKKPMVKTFLDPGLLLAVKSLPRKEKKRSSKSSSRRRGATSTGFGDSLTTGGDNGSTSSSSPEEQWEDASKQLVKTLCLQCRAAAEAPAEDSKHGPKTPVKPHAKAKIVARYDVTLPDAVTEKMGGFKIDPIEIHYLRIEESAQFSRLAKYYRRAAKTKGEEFSENSESGMWFDSFKSGSAPDSKRSCDVILTKQGSGGGDLIGGGTSRARQREQEIPVVVEILTVEAKDPTGGSTK